MRLTDRSLFDLSALMARGETTSEEIARAHLTRIGEQDGEIGAYLTVTAESAMEEARRADARRKGGERLSPLSGIPMAVKDNLCTKGVRTTCASRMLEHYVPPYDATAVERMRRAGAVSLGKANLDEFAMGASTERSALQLTKNPLDLLRVPGGSSGGSAAAVAAGEAVFALGSDTGGSVRQPAAFCNLVGMKPTYGRVSRYGLVAFASSLDQIGPLTRTVRDSALVLSALSGLDPRDATSADRPPEDFTATLERGVQGLSLALPDELFGEGISPDVLCAVEAAARRLERLGARLKRVSMPALPYALPAYYLISSAEASSNLARFDGVRYGFRAETYKDLSELYEKTRSEGFGEEVKRRILLGTFALSAGYAEQYYRRALKVRSLVSDQFAATLSECDAILSPVTTSVAFLLGEKVDDPMAMYRGDLCTVPASIAGLPALSVPCGRGENGLPVGLQLIGRAFDEATLYRAAYALEREGF